MPITIPRAALLAIALFLTPTIRAADNDPIAQAIAQLTSTNPQSRADAAAQLRTLGPDAAIAIPPLIKLLQDQTPTKPHEESALAPTGKIFPSPGMEAAQTLAKMGGPSLAPLTIAATSPDPTTRQRALWALIHWQDPRGEALKQALTDRDPDIRTLAAANLTIVQGINPLGALLNAAKDPTPEVRSAAVHSLGNISHSERAADTIIALMQTDPDPEVKQSAITALGNSSDPRAHNLLVAALNNTDPATRSTAIQMLGHSRDPRAVPPLLTLLKDNSPRIKMQAATSLAQIKSQEAIPALIDSITDQDPRVKNAALDALGKITGQSFGVDEAQWQKWWQANKARYPAQPADNK